MNIEEKITFLKNNGWSYRKLAEYFKVSQTTIMRWHKGIYKPKYYLAINAKLYRLIVARSILNKRKNKIDFKLGQKIILKKSGREGIIEDIEEYKDGTKSYWIGFKDNPKSHVTWHCKFKENEIESNALIDNSEEKVQKAFEEFKDKVIVDNSPVFANIDEEIKYHENELAKLKAQREAEKWQFTEDEKVILRNIDKQYKWIGRDTEGTLWFYDTKPTYTIGYGNAKYIDLFNHLFRCIKIQDEPCEFRKFI